MVLIYNVYGAGTANPSGAHECVPSYCNGGPVQQWLVGGP